MFPSETLERLETVLTALAKNEADQLRSGLTTSAQETRYALRDARRVHEALKEAREALTLPVYKAPRKESDLTEGELLALRDNDPLAGTEFREMATLFLQMMGLLHDVSGALKHRETRLAVVPEARPDSDGLAHPPEWWPSEWTAEAMRLLECRAQSLHDSTRGFTRPLQK